MAAPHMASHPQMDDALQSTHIQRTTRSGRKLWYRLTVLQEPERARACGSGPKSTTDRRPVDPPPVIELRIFEGESMASGKDITFTYNANFFLFTTLEHARPVANGRVNTPAATTPPVLTGMFVSGMAYLDRPAEAGYFLFPDLSVRHEGRYKLIFNLYEQTKEDKDKEPENGHQAHRAPQSHGNLADLDESFDHRLKVESRPFSVYSAKKFPGLTESTVLSRTISEQGCRVRIRRDVRMRRRENKSSAAGNDYEVKQKEEYERRQRTHTPEIKPDPYRSRSLSNSSMDRAPYPDPYHRRPSVAEYHHQQPPPPPPAYGPAPHTPTSAGGHLQFGQPTGSQYPPPPQQYPPQQAQASPLTPKQQNYPPQQRSYPPPPSQYAPPPPSASPRPLGHGIERPASRPNQYAMSSRDSGDNSRRPSGSYAAQKSEHRAAYPTMRSVEPRAPPPAGEPHTSSNYPPPPSADSASGSYPTTPSAESHSANEYISLPGVKCEDPKSMPRKCDFRLPPIADFDRPNYVRLPPPSTFSNAGAPPPPVSGSKRAFDQSFNPEGLYQSLSNGARQTDPHIFPPVNRMPGYDEPTGPSLQYRRADGNVDAKDPGHIAPPSASSAPREQFHRAPYNL